MHDSLEPAPERNADGTQSIRRAVQILAVLAAGRDSGVRLTDVTARTGFSRPTCHRILRVLVEEGIVEQNSASRRYAIGEQIPMLALARVGRSPLMRAAEPELRRVCSEIGDTVFLTVRNGLDTLCLTRRFGQFPVQVLMIDSGERRPLGVSSAGIAMLAMLPKQEVDTILIRNKARIAPFGLSLPRIRDLVAMTQSSGYVLRERGLVPGTKVVSVAFSGRNGTPLAALTIAATDRRMPPQRMVEVAGFLKACAERIKIGLDR